MISAITFNRRRTLIVGGIGIAAAAVGTFSSRSASQALHDDVKPLPGYASWKDRDSVIVHSSNAMETRREAFGTCGVTDDNVLFVRHNLAPDLSMGTDRDGWRIAIDGVVRPRSLTIADLKRMGVETVAMVLQCAGNGRAFFDHKASGTQWRTGAMGCTLWSGIAVKRMVVALGGVLDGMHFMTSTDGEAIAADVDPGRGIVERSVPLAAMEDALLAWELNGAPIPVAHGGPLRMIIPGYYGINSVKYVKRLAFTKEQSKTSLQGSGYRLRPIGMKAATTQASIWEMNLKSVITNPSGGQLPEGQTQIYGVAFASQVVIHAVEISLNGGRTWRLAQFFGPNLGRYAWRQFVLSVNFARGRYLIASRAIGTDGSVQPATRPANERGYGNTGWRAHAVELTVA